MAALRGRGANARVQEQGCLALRNITANNADDKLAAGKAGRSRLCCGRWSLGEMKQRGQSPKGLMPGGKVGARGGCSEHTVESGAQRNCHVHQNTNSKLVKIVFCLPP